MYRGLSEVAGVMGDGLWCPLTVIAICRSKGMDAINVVEKRMKLWYVEMFTNSELDNDIFVAVKHFQAGFKRNEHQGGVRLQLR